MHTKKGAMEMDKIVQIVIGIVVLALTIVLIILAKLKGSGAIAYIKHIFGGG